MRQAACCMWHATTHFVFSFVANFKKSTFTSVLFQCVCVCVCVWRIPRNHVAAAEPHPRFQVCVCIFSSHTFYLQTYLSLRKRESERERVSRESCSSLANFRFVVRPEDTKNQFFVSSSRVDLSHDLNSWLCRHPGMNKFCVKLWVFKKKKRMRVRKNTHPQHRKI